MLNLPKHISIALLIDAENISSPQEISLIAQQLQTHQGPVLKRAYGNWFADNLKGLRSLLVPYEIEPVHSLPAPESGKNSTDIRLVIDAMDLLHDQQIDCFWIVSGDRDFMPLVRRLKQNGKTLIGAGRSNTPLVLRESYHQFINLDELGSSESNLQNHLQAAKTTQPALHIVPSPAETKQTQTKKAANASSKKAENAAKSAAQTASKPYKKELVEISKTAYKAVLGKAAANGEWITLAQLEPQLKTLCEQKIKKNFSCKLFGCNGLVKLIDQAGIFEWDTQQGAKTNAKSRRLRLRAAA
ncbi:MAG: hypothetical protein Fur0046_30620 [Cyanobacteria bacterium J069]